MKVSGAALAFLILAAALGSQARVIHDTETREFMMENLQLESSVMNHGFALPADCCFSYTPRSIRCSVMRDYFVTSSACSQPGVMPRNNDSFLRKRDKKGQLPHLQLSCPNTSCEFLGLNYFKKVLFCFHCKSNTSNKEYSILRGI
ncbi:C-C motif chemokine 15-like isoform X1 [Lemur catta]|uniref:C-C motif chemokine 15-like isoform X1 n=1 Tax=Lemur catta TaxID=9447 RepID=UPI001E26CED9|nr:C-C motif chemokine 15-like isoform X1 [Lemur catta]